MFGLFRRKDDPDAFHNRKTRPENPGKGVSGKFMRERNGRSRKESFDLPRMLEQSLRRQGHKFQRHKTAVSDSGTGLVFQPLLANFQPRDDGTAQTTTTIEVSHPELLPGGVFEYQHWTGRTFAESLNTGFDQWAQADLPVFLDLFETQPKNCTAMEMTFEKDWNKPERRRRVLLGPVAAFCKDNPTTEACEAGQHPPFCNCCLFTNTMPAFREHLESDQVHAIRFFGSRHVEAQADCRINGLDYDTGKQAIIDYVNRWPDRGFEFRKQLVIIHST